MQTDESSAQKDVILSEFYFFSNRSSKTEHTATIGQRRAQERDLRWPPTEIFTFELQTWLSLTNAAQCDRRMEISRDDKQDQPSVLAGQEADGGKRPLLALAKKCWGSLEKDDRQGVEPN